MIIEPFVVAGLGNSSYLIGSSQAGIAAIVDPERNIDGYMEAAQRLGVRIIFSLETHLHADFVSGSRELASRTGASIGASAAAGLQFEHLPLKEGNQIQLGELALEVIETPGHSPEHISFLVREQDKAQPSALFSGGTLIAGGVARTDLLGHEHTQTLTLQLYHTLRTKIMSLPDEVQVYPTHGSGSFCVVSQEESRTTTIGRERQHNPLLRAVSVEEFVRLALEGLPSYPAYFRRMRPLNQQGPAVLGKLPPLVPLSAQEVRRLMEREAVAVDTRPFPHFARGHIPGAYSIPLQDSFASWLGWVVPPDHSLVFVAQGALENEEIVRQSVRIGYEDLDGYLEGGMAAWGEAGFPVEGAELTTPRQVYQEQKKGNEQVVVDVRQDAEWQESHIPGAIHIELGELEAKAAQLPRDAVINVTCSHGNRSSTGVSLLQRLGFKKVKNIAGGMTEWQRCSLPVEKP